MQLLRNSDAKEATGSSPEAVAQASSVQDSSSANIKIDTSVDVKKPEFNPQGIAAQIKAKYNIDQKDSKTDAASQTEVKVEDGEKADEKEKLSEEGLVHNLNETTEEKLARESKEKTEAQKTPDEKLPFHKHPRFQEVITERNKFEEEVKTYKPVAERMLVVEKFCRENNVAAEDYDASLRLAALIVNNPSEALTRLEKVVENLRVQTGSALPTDLQTQVDEGKLSLTHAQEMAKLRIEATGAKAKAVTSQTQSAAQLQQQLVNGLESWNVSRMKTDPSFKPKQQGQEDGKYELVTDKFLSLWQRNPPASVEQAVALCEQAYKSVHEFIERTMPKPQIKRPLTPKHSETQQREAVDIRKPGWAKKVAQSVLANAN